MNLNGRTYPKITEEQLDILKKKIDEKVLFGEMFHPDSNERHITLNRVSHVITDVYNESGATYAEGHTLNTEYGKSLRSAMERGYPFNLSARMVGRVVDGEIVDADLITFDAMPLTKKQIRFQKVNRILNRH